ncbi:hypothetical protein OAJ94_01500 [Deltaproteobacteria bacterium]|nr:hypothetical protein [Deltaproteobacteria bacterium]
MEELVELMKNKGIKRFVHFHTDHWEPFSGNWDQWGEEASENSDLILKFLEETNNHPFFNKMTLFYNHPVRTSSSLTPNSNGDLLNFKPQNPPFWKRYTYAVKRVAQESEHEFQVHIHHEGITNGDFFKFGHLPWPEGHEHEKIDAARLERYIQATLADMMKIVPLSLDNWHFLHGVWALNASDLRVCTVVNEIEMLIKNGCIGDFSMPAGRRIVDSTIKVPHTVLAVNASKGYDLPEADGRIIGNVSDSKEPRFLIWNQDIPFTHCSIDHYGSKAISDALSDWYGTLKIWIENSPIIGDTAFVKTHAHSMNRIYWDEGSERTFNSPKVLKLFQSLMEICNLSSVDYVKWTVDEVIEYLISVDPSLKHSFSRKVIP